MTKLHLPLTCVFSLYPWHVFSFIYVQWLYSLSLLHEVPFFNSDKKFLTSPLIQVHEVSFFNLNKTLFPLPLPWGFFLTSDMSLKLASSFSLSCCRSLMFCSCMSSNAWPVTSISLSRASSLCTIRLIGRTKNIMQQNEFWTAHLLKNHKRS